MGDNKKYNLGYYGYIADDIKEKILDETYRYMDYIPSMVDLCKEYEVSKPTMSRVYNLLLNDGFIKIVGHRYAACKKIEKNHTTEKKEKKMAVTSIKNLNKKNVTETIEKKVLSNENETEKKIDIINTVNKIEKNNGTAKIIISLSEHVKIEITVTDDSKK